jgi:hypothetical protein
VTDSQHALEQAIQAIQYGNPTTGRRLLAQALQADPRNVQAWLWMSQVVDTDEQRRDCLQRVLAIQPQNRAARAQLAQIEARATILTDSQHRQARRKIVLAGGLALSLICGLVLLLYTLLAVVPRARARTKRLSESAPKTATIWCPACAHEGRAVLLQTSLGAGLFGGPSGELAHGTTVAVLDYQWSPLEQRYYAEVIAGGQRGWVAESLLRE